MRIFITSIEALFYSIPITYMKLRKIIRRQKLRREQMRVLLVS